MDISDLRYTNEYNDFQMEWHMWAFENIEKVNKN